MEATAIAGLLGPPPLECEPKLGPAAVPAAGSRPRMSRGVRGSSWSFSGAEGCGEAGIAVSPHSAEANRSSTTGWTRSSSLPSCKNASGVMIAATAEPEARATKSPTKPANSFCKLPAIITQPVPKPAKCTSDRSCYPNRYKSAFHHPIPTIPKKLPGRYSPPTLLRLPGAIPDSEYRPFCQNSPEFPALGWYANGQ